MNRLPSFCVLFLTGCLACATLPVHAQAMPDPATPFTEVVFMGWERAQDGLFTTEDGRNFIPLEAPAYAFGKPVRVKPEPTLKVYQKITRDGVPAYEPAGEAALPPGCRNAQAFLVPQPDGEGLRSYRIVAMSNDAEVFGNGAVRVFNFSRYPAMSKVGGTTLPLAPLEWKTVPGEPDKKFRVPLITSLQVAGGWTRPVRNLVSLPPQHRGNVMIVYTLAGIGEIAEAAGDARLMVLAAGEYIPQSQYATTRHP